VAKAKQTACPTEGCEETVSVRSKFKVCVLCRSSQRRWMDRKPAEVLERRRKLRMYDDRLNYVIKPKRT
jgi:hypothetical protein